MKNVIEPRNNAEYVIFYQLKLSHTVIDTLDLDLSWSSGVLALEQHTINVLHNMLSAIYPECDSFYGLTSYVENDKLIIMDEHCARLYTETETLKGSIIGE